MPAPSDFLLIFSTCPDHASADRIAAALVSERLAACVQLSQGVRSTYRWQGQVEQSEEVALVAKTARDRADAAITRLTELHPYELPEAVAVELTAGLPDYLSWIHQETRKDP